MSCQPVLALAVVPMAHHAALNALHAKRPGKQIQIVELHIVASDELSAESESQISASVSYSLDLHAATLCGGGLREVYQCEGAFLRRPLSV